MKSKRYSQEFKEQAVRMVVMEGKPLQTVARELGVSDTTLRAWRDKYLAESSRHPRGEGMPSPAEMAEEIKQLRKELARVTWQRDILKKTAGILTERCSGGMN